MNTLEIKHLRMVRMLSITGNMTRAAASLCVTQSALSQQLKEVESRLGTPLFLRTGKKMVPTRAGSLLLSRALPIIDQVEAAEFELAQLSGEEEGELKVGVRCMFCYMWLPRVLTLFQEKFANIDLEMGNADDPESDLLARRIDVAVFAADTWDTRIEATPLFEDEVVVVMSHNHPLKVKPYLALADFHGADIIALVDKPGHYFFQDLENNPDIRPGRYMIISHPEAMVDCIRAGLGIGVLPKWFAAPYMQSKNLISKPLTARGKRLVWKAAWLKSAVIPSYQKEFIRLMTAHAMV